MQKPRGFDLGGVLAMCLSVEQLGHEIAETLLTAPRIPSSWQVSNPFARVAILRTDGAEQFRQSPWKLAVEHDIPLTLGLRHVTVLLGSQRSLCMVTRVDN